VADLELTQGDTAPDIQYKLHEAGNPNAPLDLTGATVAFQMRKPDDRRYTVNAQATVDADPTTGLVTYEWGPNDLAVPGEYQGQFEVTYQDGKIQTTKTPFTIEVRRQ